MLSEVNNYPEQGGRRFNGCSTTGSCDHRIQAPFFATSSYLYFFGALCTDSVQCLMRKWLNEPDSEDQTNPDK